MVSDVRNKKMVVGFLFTGARVLLVQKDHPEWQRGLFNGVGGVVEDSETPAVAMIREFREETKCERDIDWRHFATEIEPFNSYVYFFAARTDWAMYHQWPDANDVGEKLRWMVVDEHFRNRIGNLSWLIPLALDPRKLEPVTVQARGDIRECVTW